MLFSCSVSKNHNQVDSARYGIIGAYVTNQFIKKGEEVFSNYGPRYANLLEKDINPTKGWYFSLWQKFKEEHPNEKIFIKNFEDINKKIYWQVR